MTGYLPMAGKNAAIRPSIGFNDGFNDRQI